MFEGTEGSGVRRAITAAAWLLVAFLAAETIATLSGIRYIGAGIAPANTISVSGHGEIQAAPTLAEVSFSVVSDKSTAQAAQNDAATKQAAVSAYLKQAGIADSDIQTSGYSVYPQYEYQNAVCPQPAPPVYNGSSGSASSQAIAYCPPGKQVLTGYEARQSTTVKIRDLTKVGDVLAGVGQAGATEISSPDFTFDDPNAPQEQAREKAIADAKAKADTLAKELGVSLVRVVSFSENGGGAPVPMLYAAASAGSTAKSSAPQINPGQNTVTDDVTITYEIR